MPGKGQSKRQKEPGKRPLKKALDQEATSLTQVSNRTTKNEPVVGRNNFQRARPCRGAKLTPWLWIGGTKEVRTLLNGRMILLDTGGALP